MLGGNRLLEEIGEVSMYRKKKFVGKKRCIVEGVSRSSIGIGFLICSRRVKVIRWGRVFRKELLGKGNVMFMVEM